MTNRSQSDAELARKLYGEWDYGKGTSKSELERRTWGDGSSHGRRFDRFVRQNLGVTTTSPSKLTDRISDLERQVRSLGHYPIGASIADWEHDVQHARQACLAALRGWNDPTSQFRTASFSLLFVTAWNALAIAILKKANKEWRKLGDNGTPTLFDGIEQASDTSKLVTEALDGDNNRGTRENIQFWINLRNSVAHRFLPSVDLRVIPYAQAGLLNFERILTTSFGEDFEIGDALSVPLQLSGFRDPEILSYKKLLQAKLPPEVQSILSQAEQAPPELLNDETFTIRIALIPMVPSSGRNPDAVAWFVKPGEMPPDLSETISEYLVLSKPIRGERPNFNAKKVVEIVSSKISFRFNTRDHAEVGRRLAVRPPLGEEDRTLDVRFAEYISALKAYLYSQLWIDRLTKDLADEAKFEKLTGKPAVPKDNTLPN